MTTSTNTVKLTNNINVKSNASAKASSTKSTVKCFKCGARHLLKDCDTYKKKLTSDPKYFPKGLADFKRRNRRYVNNVQPTESKEAELKFSCSLSTHIYNLNSFKSFNIYLDSGASDHVFNHINDQDTVYQFDSEFTSFS